MIVRHVLTDPKDDATPLVVKRHPDGWMTMHPGDVWNMLVLSPAQCEALKVLLSE